MADQPQGRKSLPYWGFGVVVIVYLAIIQVGGILVDGWATMTTRPRPPKA